jgi:hypothetical protein
MKRKLNRFWVLFLSLVTCLFLWLPQVNAQNAKHELMFWGEAGYSAFLTKWDSFTTAGNFGSGIGLGYNVVLWNHFIISGGVEYVWLTSSVKPTNLIIHRDLIDTEGDEYVMEYNFNKLTQTDKTHNLFIPVYIGFITDLKKVDFYMLAGAKAGYMFASGYTTKIASYTTIGIYDRFFDPFEEMPNHFFDTRKYQSTSSLNFNKLQAVASMEMGIEIPSAFGRNALRISLFADYGLLNRQSSENDQNNKELIIYHQVPNDISVNSLYETDYKRSTITNSFFAGVKITLLFDVTRASRRDCRNR